MKTDTRKTLAIRLPSSVIKMLPAEGKGKYIESLIKKDNEVKK